MKRWILWLLPCLCLCVAGCVLSPQEPPATQTAAQTELLPTQSLPTELSVQVDDSKYTPYRPSASVYTRLSEEWIPDLQPSGDYGAIYPFAGVPVYDENGTVGSYYYGLCDESGRIIADPTYVKIELAPYYDTNAGIMRKLPMWLLCRIEAADTEQEQEQGAFVDADIRYALATPDGARVTPCEYVQVNAMADYVAASRADGSFDIFNMLGERVLSSQELNFAYRLTDDAADCFMYADGLFTVKLWDGFYYMDTLGELRLGPYEQASPFSEGVAAVTRDSEHFGYIRKDGGWAIEPQYSWAGDFHGGLATVGLETGEEAAIDRQGNAAIAGFEYITPTSFGFSADKDMRHYFFDKHGQSLEISYLEDNWCYAGCGAVYYHEGKGGLSLVNVETGQELFADKAQYAYALDGERGMAANAADQLPFAWLTAWNNEEWQSWLLDVRTMELADLPLEGRNGEVCADSLGGQSWLIFRKPSTGETQVMNTKLQTIKSCRGEAEVINNRIRTTDEWSCTYTDLDGKVLFRYPLTLGLDD